MLYVAFTKDLMIRRRVDQFLREHGVTVAVESEFDTIENIKRAIEVGQGVSLLPEPTFRQEVAGRHARGPAAGRAAGSCGPSASSIGGSRA